MAMELTVKEHDVDSGVQQQEMEKNIGLQQFKSD